MADKVIMQPSYRPHCASCPSVCPSVCPVRASNSKTKNVDKSKLSQTFPRTRVECQCQFSDERLKVKVTGRQNLRKLVSCLHTGGGSGAGGSSADFTLGPYAIVRPNLLTTPGHETFGNWTDGRMSCRHSAPTSALGADMRCCCNNKTEFLTYIV